MEQRQDRIEPRRHAACDECRLRKLKCSGERPHCERCRRENVGCVYSIQKQMGRPRKRRKDDPNVTQPGQGLDQPLEMFHSELSSFDLNAPDLGTNDILGHSQPDSIDPLLEDAPLDAVLQNRDLLAQSSHEGGYADPNHQHSLPEGHTHGPDPLTIRVSPPCACLSTMYLILSNLQSQPSFEFPYILPPLRNAIATSAAVLKCPHCPKAPATAFQNVNQLTTLLVTIVDSLRSVLLTIDAEAKRVDELGVNKPFHMADASAPLHMHTGTPECPVRFDMELSGQEWRTLARKVLKSQFVGSTSDTHDSTLLGIVSQFGKRQMYWHEDPELLQLRAHMFGEHIARRVGPDSEERICGMMIENVRTSILQLGL